MAVTHDDFRKTEHTGADAPNREAGNLQALKAAKEPSAVGVPDVDALIHNLRADAKHFRGMNSMFDGICESAEKAADALTALQDKVTTKTTHIANLNDCITQQAATIKELKAERDALKANDARYRWLRDEAPSDEVERLWWTLNNADIDKEIDMAMKEEK